VIGPDYEARDGPIERKPLNAQRYELQIERNEE